MNTLLFSALATLNTIIILCCGWLTNEYYTTGHGLHPAASLVIVIISLLISFLAHLLHTTAKDHEILDDPTNLDWPKLG